MSISPQFDDYEKDESDNDVDEDYDYLMCEKITNSNSFKEAVKNLNRIFPLVEEFVFLFLRQLFDQLH